MFCWVEYTGDMHKLKGEYYHQCFVSQLKQRNLT